MTQRVTVVSGSTYTGLYAPDGSINVVYAPGGSYVGRYHPCGAWWVTDAPGGGFTGLHAPDGSLYIVEEGSEITYSGALRVVGAVVSHPQIRIIGLGQSDFGGFLSESSSPPAALSGTYYFDPDTDQWTTPPAANGIREFLNGVYTRTGQTVGMVAYAQAAAALADLSEGTAFFTELASRIAASGGQAHYIVMHHGHGNVAGAGTTQASYHSQLSALHQSLADEVGKTKATLPLIVSGLQRFVEVTGRPGTESQWNEIQRALINAETSLTNVYYSHSNLDSALMLDNAHMAAAGHGESGKRYARTIAYLRGNVPTKTPWFISTATYVDATHTDVTVTHSAGSDLIPASGITGFEVSGDNGATWVSATGARQIATTIRLTHASLGGSRKLRYHNGYAPDISGVVKDNSDIAIPLTLTTGDITVQGGPASPPTPTYIGSIVATASGGNLTHTSSFVTPTPGLNRRIYGIMVGGFQSPDPSSITVGGVAATIHDARHQDFGFGGAWFSASVPSGTNFDVVATFPSAPTTAVQFNIWEVDESLLTSTTPQVGFNYEGDFTGTKSTISTTVAVSEGGFILVSGQHWNQFVSGGDLASEVGDITIRGTPQGFSGTVSVIGDQSGIAADAAYTVTHTLPSPANFMTVYVAALR